MRPWRAHLAALGVYFCLAVLMTYPLARQTTHAFPDIGEDGWKTYWNYWWVRHALLDLQTNPLHTPMIYAPTGASLNFDQLALVNDLIVLPLQLALGTLVAYNLAILLWFTLSGYAGYLLNRYLLNRALPPERRFTPSTHLAAFTGGLVFAFSPTQFGRVAGGGQMLMAVQWLALFVLFTLMGAQEGRFDRKRLALAGVCLAWGALTDWYQPLWGAFWLALFAATHLWQLRRVGYRAMLGFLGRMAFSAAVTAACLAPVLFEMINTLVTYGGANFRVPYDHYVGSSADLLSFVTPPERHPLLGSAVLPLASRFTESFFEHTNFVGYTVIILCVIGLKAHWRATRFWLAGAIVFGIYILGPVLHIAGQEVFYPMPFEAFYRFAPVVAQFARSVSRGDIMVMLCLGVIAAFGACQLRLRRSVWLVPLVIAFEYLWIPLPSTPFYVSDYYRRLAAETGDFAIMRLPMEFNRREDMLFQTVHGKRMTTGFTSREDPATWLKRVPVLQHFRHRGYDVIAQDLKTVAPTVLQDLGVRYIVVDYGQMPPPSDELYYWEDHGAELVGDQPPVYQDERLKVYLAPPLVRAVPYLRLESGWGILDPEDWGTPQAEGWRAIAPQAGLTIVARQPQILRLRFKAKSPSASDLRILRDQQLIGQYQLGARAQVFVTTGFQVLPGENALTIAYVGAPFSVKVNALDLTD